jgi:ribosomal protein S18
MDSINFALDVNGVRADRSEMELLPGGNFRMDNPGLVADNNQYSLEMLPGPRQYDRFDGYSVAYQWTPAVDSAEWLLPGGAVTGVINVRVPANTKVLKFSNMRPVGFLSAAGGVAKDSISSGEDVRYIAVKENVFRTGLKVEGIAKYGDGVLKDLSKPNSKLEYLIITPAEFVDQARALAEFRNDGTSVGSFATSVVVAEDIYDRYTGGRMSPIAIRNYIAYVYSVCPNFRYVLLAGAGHFDYRDIKTLQRYIDSYGAIEPIAKTGLSAKQQRQLATAVKRARHLGLLPFVSNN